MFTTVKALSALIDKEMEFVEGVKATKSLFEETKYNEYMNKMENTLINRLLRLEEISTNKKLIQKYWSKLETLFN